MMKIINVFGFVYSYYYSLYKVFLAYKFRIINIQI